MFQEERSDLVEQIKDVSLNLLVVDKLTFVYTSETGKADDAVVIVKEVFAEKNGGSIVIDTILKHLEFFKNGNRIAGICPILQPSQFKSLPNSPMNTALVKSLKFQILIRQGIPFVFETATVHNHTRIFIVRHDRCNTVVSLIRSAIV